MTVIFYLQAAAFLLSYFATASIAEAAKVPAPLPTPPRTALPPGRSSLYGMRFLPANNYIQN